MKKNLVIYGIAMSLFAFGLLSFIIAYNDMQRYSLLTNRSISVANDFQELSRLINNAAVIHPDLIRKAPSDSKLFFVDSLSLIKVLKRLNNNVRDSINIKIAKVLESLVKKEISWLLRSNVPDSIINKKSFKHLAYLQTIDSLIKKGISRTDFLFKYRQKKLESSLNEVKLRIGIFLGLACLLILFVTVGFFKQRQEKRQKEGELIQQEKRFQAMVEHNQDLIVIVDDSMNILYRSPSAEQITGFKNEERGPNVNLDEVHFEDRGKIEEYIKEMKLNPGKVIPATFRIKHKNGHYVWLEGTFTSLFHDKNIKGIVINVKDVSEQKMAQEEIIKSELRFRQTLENMMEGVQIIGFDWRYIYVNDALTKYSTYGRNEMIGRTVMEIYPGVEQTKLYSSLMTCMEKRLNAQLESEFIFPDGTKKYFDLSIQASPEGIFILSVDISERKKTEEMLKKNIQELSDYKYALDESSIVAMTDQKGIIQHVNDNFCKISRYSKHELIGQDHRIINSAHHSKDFIRNLWTTIANGHVWKGELKNRASNGSIYWVDTTIVPFLNAMGKPYQYLAIRNDITERKKAEEEIVKLNRLYAFISAINQSIVHFTDESMLLKKACDIAIKTGGFKLARIEMITENGTLERVSIRGHNESVEEANNLTGTNYSGTIAKATPIGKTLQSGKYEVNNDMVNDPALEAIKDVLIRAGVQSGISLPIKKFGRMVGIFNLSSGQPDFFDRREIELLLEAAGDISFALENFEKTRNHKITEEKLIHNEQRFRALIEKSTDMKTLTSSGGYFVYASPSVSTTFGYTDDEFLNKPAYDFFHPEDVHDLLRKRTEILDRPGSSFSFQYRARHKKGHWIWCEGTLTNMLHEPSINALVSNFRDISEVKQAEEQKEFDRNNLNALINNTNNLLWSIDKNFKLITFNQPFYEAIKLTSGREPKQGDDVLSLALSDEQQNRFKTFYIRAFAGEIFTEIDIIEDLTDYASEISFFPMLNGDEIIGTSCHSRDISVQIKEEKEREKMIADLLRYSKNLEQFAYVVSHNLRAPVANILGLSNVLKSGLGKADQERSQEFLYRAVEQLDVTVKDLNKILEVRSLAGQIEENVNLKEVLDGIKLGINNLIQSEHVEIEENFSMHNIHTIKGYIHSIFYNLITNSIKYRKPHLAPVIRISCYVEHGIFFIVFTDNGRGMNLEQYGNRVFGLYQRFHLDIVGKGMGLFMVKTQVEALEGTISLQSKDGQGSKFTIELPSKIVVS